MYKKINGSLKRCQRKITSAIEKYNNMDNLPNTTRSPLPLDISEDKIASTENADGLKSQLASMVERLDRCHEEQEMITQEVENISHAFTEQIKMYASWIGRLNSQSPSEKGKISRLQVMGAALEFQKHWIQTTFPHLGNDDHAMCFSKRIGWVDSESVASDEEEIEENFDS